MAKQRSAVDQAIDQRGRANPRRMAGWSAYCSACKEIEDLFEEHKNLIPSVDWMGLPHGATYGHLKDYSIAITFP